MRLYTASSEKTLRARKLLADWASEGLLTQAQYQRLEQETVSELRTTNIGDRGLFVAGFGELVGYGLRSVSGYFADKTRQYWAVTFLGYAINMLAVPALGLAGNWPLAAALIIAERTGRAIWRPAVEAMSSHAGSVMGQGWVFGLNEALDQTGATLGPLITAYVLWRHGGYHYAFGVLLISALCCLAVLVVARMVHRPLDQMEQEQRRTSDSHGFSRTGSIWLRALALPPASPTSR